MRNTLNNEIQMEITWLFLSSNVEFDYLVNCISILINLNQRHFLAQTLVGSFVYLLSGEVDKKWN